MTRLARQRSGRLVLSCFLVWEAACLSRCGTKPGGPQDEEHLLSGRWSFRSTGSELFNPERMLVAQTEEDVRILLEGSLFGTHFERIALSPGAPEALVVQITFTRLELDSQYEVLTLALDGRLQDLDHLHGQYELRGNLSSGGTLRLESGPFTALRVRAAP